MKYGYPKSSLIPMLFFAASTGFSIHAQTALLPGKMPQIGEVDPRFVSFNVEAVEITGGRFWKPYNAVEEKSVPPPEKAGANQPIGMDASLFQYRPPIQLANPRLRKLAAALSPSYLRVSGTWKNSTFFQDDDKPPLTAIPNGYKGIMTRSEWKNVVDFSHAIGAEIVTSVATSEGARDANGVWTPAQAKAFFDYSKSIGGHIAATEFMNEPTFAAIGGAPPSYDAAAFAKDVAIFKTFLRKESADTLFLGPGSVGEGVSLGEGAPMPKMIATEDMLKATGPAFDAFSYHFYGTVSQRCLGAMAAKAAMTPEKALTAEWLQRNLTVESFYAHLRDSYLPGKPMWLTETGEAACGGDPFASQFVDAFRYMDQLGSLAQKSVKTVMVNTLASSDYGLLDENTLEPRPNYWAAVLWKRTMGTRALSPEISTPPNLRVYAQCAKEMKGGVTLLVLNLDQSTERVLDLPIGGKRYTLSAPDLLSSQVALNGVQLKAAQDGTLPSLEGASIPAGAVHFSPLTITFLVLPESKNSSCR